MKKKIASGPVFAETDPYSAFAYCYDRVMDHIDHGAWAAGIDRYLCTYLETRGRLLDLGCGTGKLTCGLGRIGWAVAGIDLSPAMLELAAGNAAAAGIPFPCSCQDMRFFSLDNHPDTAPVDAVLCLHDGMNYLTELFEFDLVFDRVAAALRPGGLWIFDYSTRWNIRKNFAGRRFVEEGDDYALLWLNRYNRLNGRLAVVLELVRQTQAGSSLTREVHLQRVFRLPVVRRRLLRSGAFELLGIYDGYTQQPVRPDSVEVTLVARRR